MVCGRAAIATCWDSTAPNSLPIWSRTLRARATTWSASVRAASPNGLTLSRTNSRHSALRRDKRDFTQRLYRRDRKSTRLNSSHVKISYAVFCLKKKKKNHKTKNIKKKIKNKKTTKK